MAESVIKILNELCSKFGLVIDWTAENVLPYLQTLMNKYINYSKSIDVMCIIIGSILLVGGIALIIADCTCWDSIAICFLGAVLSMAGLGLVIGYTVDLIKCINIPELKFYNVLQSLLKQ